MFSRFRSNRWTWTLSACVVALAVAAGSGRAQPAGGTLPAAPGGQGVVPSTSLFPGIPREPTLSTPYAAKIQGDPERINNGKRLYSWYNCNGCHFNGGGGMGPPLMDDQWIYGGRLDQIHLSLLHGRPNGMPTWANKIPDSELWDIAAYVKSLSTKSTTRGSGQVAPDTPPAPTPSPAQFGEPTSLGSSGK